MEEADYPLVSAIMLVGRVSIPDIQIAIKCFKSQTYPYCELIIVNNAKTQFDASALNLKAEKDVAIIDTPYEFFAGMARNYGISCANGQIIAQFDADYWHAPNRLEAQIASLAQNGAMVSILSQTLNYSFVSGRASYNTNNRNAILGTMVFVRPQNIDYPNVDKQEELGLLDKFQKAGSSIISIPVPELACKLCLTKNKRIVKPINAGLSQEHYKVAKSVLKQYKISTSPKTDLA